LIHDARPDARLLGVDPDPWMVDGAQPWLAARVRLVQAGAQEFLRRNRRRFHLIVDDCFELRRGVPVRPASCMTLAPLVERSLTPDGVYLRNVLPAADGRYADQVRDVRETFRHVQVRWFKSWENRLILASGRPLPRATPQLLAGRATPGRSRRAGRPQRGAAAGSSHKGTKPTWRTMR
jgi:hypothetical protein